MSIQLDSHNHLPQEKNKRKKISIAQLSCFAMILDSTLLLHTSKGCHQRTYLKSFPKFQSKMLRIGKKLNIGNKNHTEY